MKFIISILAIALFTRDCNNKDVSGLTLPNTQQETIAIIYQASSRGFFKEIIVTENNITISNDRDNQQLNSFKNNNKIWNEYLDLLAQIDINKLPNIKAPTAMRDYDGAAHATLTIKEENKEIKSRIFDHEYPPAEIKTLVEKLLSFKKNSSKQ